MRFTTLLGGLLLLSLVLIVPPAGADSVAQVQTAKRISRQTVVLIDPQGRPGTGGTTTDTTVQPGDIITYVIQFTPVPNGANRGLGGYITDYIPLNTEVVGARIIDAAGNTIRPHRGGLAPDGVGNRGPQPFTPGTLPQGSLSQLYADTGIFYSTDPRTARVPDGSVPGEAFISLFNGLGMIPDPTGANNLQQILGGTGTLFAHNVWDLAQVYAFGVNSGAIGANGEGATPDLYGSAVAGPDTFYPYEATWNWWDATAGAVILPDTANVGPLDLTGNPVVGPWMRIQTFGQETGSRGAIPDPTTGAMPDPGPATRVGVPAVDGAGALIGWPLSAAAPLPSYDPLTYDPADPTTWYTTAVRFAVGELVVGDEYFAEISLRVKDTPLDPVSGMDLNCAEVTGGDASARAADGSSGGKDNTWRYFLPAPSCVVLNNFFELAVDKLLAVPGDTLTYSLEGKNLSTNTQTNVVARLCYTTADLTFVSADSGGTNDPTGTGCPDPATQGAVLWSVGDMIPGQAFLFTAQFTVTNNANNDMTVARAIYTSGTVPAPGFQVVAATTVIGSTRIVIDAKATPGSVQVQAAPAVVGYDVDVTNTGTADADTAGCRGPGCRVLIDLPAGFTYTAGSARVTITRASGAITGPTPVGNPQLNGNQMMWTAGLVLLAPGDKITLSFDVDIAQGHTPGAYTITVESWFNDVGIGNDVSDTRAGLAEVLVDAARTAAPTVTGQPLAGGTTVSGTAVPGAEVVVYVNGVAVATVTADASGTWSATIPALFGGQVVEATAQVTGELVSGFSAGVVTTSVGSVVACNDGVDNDGDGLTDFPDDPGCVSALDLDETDLPECADTLDNDGDGLTDYPNDPKCSSWMDNSESGLPECNDGIDNDGNGLSDFPDDPGCTSADDSRETTLPACNDGIDNDGDTLIDYPLDDGCLSRLDDSEATTVQPPTDGGTPTDGGATPDGGVTDGGVVTDGGGVTDGGDSRTDPGGAARPSDEGSAGVKTKGCCNGAIASRGDPALALGALLLLGLLLPLRRRR